MVNVSVGALSILTALWLPRSDAGGAGYVYLLVPLLQRIHGYYWMQRKQELEIKMRALA